MKHVQAGTAWPSDWIVPDWPAPGHVRAVFTPRQGGVSAPPFDGFNLGDHVRDDPGAVAANRMTLADSLGARPVFLNQVHGTKVVALARDTAHGAQADACVATTPRVACTIMVADCLPVLFAHETAGVVAAAHAGWRGLAGASDPSQAASDGVLEATLGTFVQAVQRQSGGASLEALAAGIVVWLGPCIGPAAFEVGAEVREAFVRTHAGAEACFVKVPTGQEGVTPKYLADLPALARLRLSAMGLRRVYGNDGSEPWCTVSTPSRFFSHRRDATRLGSTGRMAACIWLD